TFSAGLACIKKSFSRDDLINAADQALYHAKRHGKDQIVVSQEIVSNGH
ncbi:MAG: diguanylate cyclase, partial [Calditrichia bacterium]|nr:diguanylate cyclase [Calditrichia bacterium]